MLTNIVLRPAARGGKYLGHDAANAANHSAIAAILDIKTLSVITAAYVNATTTNDPGPANLMNPISRSDAYPTDSNTVQAQLSVDIELPTTFLIALIGPLSFPDQARCALATITVLPGVDIGTSVNFPEGIVLEIPGLCISNVVANLNGTNLSASAMVTMMCGCKIGTALPYWPPTDFVIQLVTQTASGATYTYTLDFNTSPNVLSSFIGNWPNQAPNDPVVTAWISASQPKLGNQGNYFIANAEQDIWQSSLMQTINNYITNKA